ncbi:hypothetical protein ACROYT_G013171 [Oculina patagonica]
MAASPAMDSGLSNVSLLSTVTTDSSTNLTSSAKIERVFKSLFLVLIAVANIMGNSSIILIVLKDRQLRVTVRNYAANRVGVAVITAVRVPHGGRLPRARDRKWAKTLAIVIGAFLGCYLPIVVASLVHIYTGERSNPSLGKTLEILLFLTFSNTVLNPMIYSLRSYEYRKAFKKIFGRCPGEMNNNNRRLRLNYISQERESLTVSSHMISSHVNTS